MMRAAGSSLKHYMPHSKAAIIAACQEGIATARADLLAFALNVRAACAVQANLNSTASEADRSRFISDVFRLWNTDGIAATDKSTGKDTA